MNTILTSLCHPCMFWLLHWSECSDLATPLNLEGLESFIFIHATQCSFFAWNQAGLISGSQYLCCGALWAAGLLQGPWIFE